MVIDMQHKTKTVSKEREAEKPVEMQAPARATMNEVDEYFWQALQQISTTAFNLIHLQSVPG